MCPYKEGKVETGVSNRGQDRTVLGEKCKLSFQFRASLARSPGAPVPLRLGYSIRRSRMVSPDIWVGGDMPSADTTLVVFSVNVFPSIA